MKNWNSDKQKSWEHFVSLCEEEWLDTPEQIKILELLDGNKDIAIVLNYQLGNSAIDWMYRKVPALDKQAPIEFLKSEELKVRLKEALWSMPSR